MLQFVFMLSCMDQAFSVFFMQLVQTFWQEYRGRFGEPELPMPDLGRKRLTVRLEHDGIEEELVIDGCGYRLLWHLPPSGYVKVGLILNALSREYHIKGMITRELW